MAQNAAAIILAVFPAGEDRVTLDGIFEETGWRIRFTWTLQETRAALCDSPVVAVISESQLPGYTWKDLLSELQSAPNPQPLIVADRLADDRLWAEVLNLGAYDLLMKPFDSKEVLRTVAMACRSESGIAGQAHRKSLTSTAGPS